MTKGAAKHILHFPRWYPGMHNPQGGIFVKKQIESVKEFAQSVIYVGSTRGKKIQVNTVLHNPCETCDAFYYYYNPSGSLKNFICYLKGIYKCYNKAIDENGQPNLIHAHVLLRTYVIAFLLSRFKRIPYVISEHWSGYYYGVLKKKTPLYRYLLKHTLRNANKIIVVSQQLEDSLKNATGIKTDTFKIIPNIVTTGKVVLSSKKSGKIKMVSVADLKDNIKRISLIIGAVKKIDSLNLEYHIIGDGPDRNILEKLAGDNLNITIFFHGEKSNNEVLNELPKYHFLVNYSRFETFGIVPLEALLSGVPVLSATTACPEVIQTKDAGIFIKPENPEELLLSIRKMMDEFINFNTGTIQKIIVENFNENVVGEQLVNVYKTVMNADINSSVIVKN